jgi:CTP:phosphocholine cytidylyltransferase-like protein
MKAFKCDLCGQYYEPEFEISFNVNQILVTFTFHNRDICRDCKKMILTEVLKDLTRDQQWDQLLLQAQRDLK